MLVLILAFPLLFGSAHGVSRDLFGSSVTGIGDVDRDGLADVATVVCEWPAEYGNEHEPYPGVAAFSGLDGRLLWRGAVGVHPPRFSRRSLRPVGDVDQDGTEDLAFLGLRRPACEGGLHPIYELEIVLLSGRNGSTLWSFPVESGLVDADWAAIASVGDLDGDSTLDLAVVATTRYDRSGVWILSCKRGEILRWLDPDPDWWTSANSVESAGDFDRDGCADLAVIAYARGDGPRRSTGGRRRSVLIRSSEDGRRLLAIEDPGNWGPYACLGLGDVDGDDHPDLAVIGHGWDEMPWKKHGGVSWLEARIHSGSDGRLLSTLPGLLSDAKDGDLVAAGDVDRDGRPDLLFSEIKIIAGGRVRLFSASDGTLLRESEGPPPGGRNDLSEYFGYSLAAAGDVDADGVPDWIAGQCSPWGDQDSRMVVVSGRDGRAIHVIDRRSLPRYSAPR